MTLRVNANSSDRELAEFVFEIMGGQEGILEYIENAIRHGEHSRSIFYGPTTPRGTGVTIQITRY